MEVEDLFALIRTTRSKAHSKEALCGELGASTDAGYAAYVEAQKLHTLTNRMQTLLTPLSNVAHLKATRKPDDPFMLSYIKQTMEDITDITKQLN